MKRLIWIFLLAITTGVWAQPAKSVYVLLTTDMGNIKIRLYNETPQHRDNFVKLVKSGVYTDLLFHRVIKDFMIQGGDPDSKKAKPGDRLGNGSLGYLVPAEFRANLFHKKGVLAAARTGGPSNPEKKSSASQFYIVQGKKFTNGQLDTLLMQKNNQLRNELMKKAAQPYQNQLQKLQNSKNQSELNQLMVRISIKADSLYEKAPKYNYTQAQRQVYTTIGGTPHLDGDYTVFGEVTEGLEVVDKIAAVERDQFDRPLKDIKFRITLVR